MTQPPQYPKRLIEVDLPIKRISAHAKREKQGARQGHVCTLHVWWARRPLAACRAVLCSALWPDPTDELCAQQFRVAAVQALTSFAEAVSQHTEVANLTDDDFLCWLNLTKPEGKLDADNESHRAVIQDLLLRFIAAFSAWEASVEPHFLETARLLTQAAHEALGGEPGTRPLVVDPFAGGGSIPLEALRIGADAFASDLNPVAVLLNKVVLEYVPRYGNAEIRMYNAEGKEVVFQGLAEAVRYWGDWIRECAEDQLAAFYPTDPDEATPTAYLWARAIRCEGPGCGAEVPLLRSLWLGKKSGRSAGLAIIPDKRAKSLSMAVKADVGARDVAPGTVRGGSATCPCCGFTTRAADVKKQLASQAGGARSARLIAVQVDRQGTRRFRVGNEGDMRAVAGANEALSQLVQCDPLAIPCEALNPSRPHANTRGVSAVTRIGCTSFDLLYTPRQALAIHTFYSCLERMLACVAMGAPDAAAAVATALALAVDRLVYQNTSLCRWDPTRGTIKGAFSKQALAVVWDFAEANPFSDASGNWEGALQWVCQAIRANEALAREGTVAHGTATAQLLPSDSVSAFVTDPPYFAAIPYADLSDVFYVWLRRHLRLVHPELLSDDLTDKVRELIVTDAHVGPGGARKDERFFQAGMKTALSVGREEVCADGVGVIVYAEGTTAGWEAIVSAIIEAGWTVVSSWPIDTEMSGRTQAQGAASLQSSVHIVCRPRENPDGSLRDDIGDWRDVLQELPGRIHNWLPRLAREGIVGADAIFACLGPALEVFSRYSRVEKTSGETVTLGEYLEHVWATVAREALDMIFSGADTTGFEEDARLTAMWLWTLSTGANGNGQRKNGAVSSDDGDALDEEDSNGAATRSTGAGGYALEYDAARKIAQGLGAHLERLAHLVEVKGATARLLPVAERTRYLFGRDVNKPARPKKRQAQRTLFEELSEIEEADPEWGDLTAGSGKTVLDHIHQSMILFAAGRSAALRHFLVDEGSGRDERFWRLAQALSALYPAGSDEKRWVDGVLARKKALGV